MKILALDTSTETCSVALYDQGEVIQRWQHQPQQQARLLLSECDALLAEAGVVLAQIDAVAFCNGPGSFTGLRVATAAAQGIAIANDIPLVGISTLLTLAHGEFRRTAHAYLAACLDARISEVYYGCYHFYDGTYEVTRQDAVLSPQDVLLPEQKIPYFLVGNGWTVYKDQFCFNIETADEVFWPEAQDLATLAAAEYRAGKLLTPAEALPVYIRDDVAAKKK